MLRASANSMTYKSKAPQRSSGRSNSTDETARPTENELRRLESQVSIVETFSLGREILFICVICMAQFMTQGALGNCLNLLHVIGDTFSITNRGELSWLIAGYSLTVGSFILVFGRFGDVFGYKKMLIIGFAWFSIWSMVAGLAYYSNHILFIFARVLQGIGPAILMPNGLAILGATYGPGKRKAMVFCLFGACAPGGCVAAAAVAGVIVHGDPERWPWAFYSFAIVLAAIAGLAFFVIPDPPKRVSTEDMPLSEVIAQLDLLGAAVGVLSLVLINIAWNQAPIVGWGTPYVYALLIVGLALMPMFFFIELKMTSHPLIPFHALSAEVAFTLGCVACGWACFGIWIYYTFQFFQLLRGASPLLTAAWLSPVAVSGALAAVTTGLLLQRIPPSLVMLLALTAFTVGTALVMTAPVEQTYWYQTFFCVLIMPWGMDMSFPAATLILSNAELRRFILLLAPSLQRN
ncbi:hypothetical protein G7Z17_g7908 [Cylindrodendrum hubeiense]|uniref:Major facilitator superfamily (MFS) profile domain-containing protein n=1 Tax=Cylindrodendrum hubeiense TaxID=595255 RepID=A0A9P5L9H3_9HYPO|nr:hypothetical protein G7Z17_g7908 [Cylindrodendrum hubeiense]